MSPPPRSSQLPPRSTFPLTSSSPSSSQPINHSTDTYPISHHYDERLTHRIQPIHPISNPSQHQQQSTRSHILSQHQPDIEQLMHITSDFLSLFRTNDFAYEWIFDWLLHNQSEDMSNIDVSLGRGYQSLHICGLGGCASDEFQTLLSTSTLLIPVQSKGTIVAGYFIDLCQEKSSSSTNIVRDGKYVYCSSSKELIKVFRLPEQNSLDNICSVCLTRTVLFDQSVLTIDYVMISFPWQEHTTNNISFPCIVHSRTLSLHQLVQRVQHDNNVPYNNNQSSSLRHSDNVTHNSFLGVGTFGVYQSAIIPSKLANGMRSPQMDHSVPLSYGNWAIPHHMAVCTSYRNVRLGITTAEAIDLKARFVSIHNNQGVQILRRVSNPINVNFVDNNDSSIHKQRDDPSITDNHHYSSPHPSTQMISTSHNYPYTKEIQQQSSIPRISLSQRDLTHSHPSSSIFVETDRNNTECLPNDSCSIPRTITSDLHNTTPILPYHQPITIGSQPQYTPDVVQRVDEIPSSVVDSIEAVVLEPNSAPPTPTEVMKRTRSAPACTFQSTNPKYTASPTTINQPNITPALAPTSVTPSNIIASGGNNNNGNISAEETKKEENSILLPTFKKTLPAPTKSEIVIRNRISAQRSNEKRRRKIEATKSELAYLRSTYLPQLRQKRGCLVSENQNLRLQFMERYHESDIESFM